LSSATLFVEGGGIRVEPYGARRLKDGIGAWQPVKKIIASNKKLNRLIDRLLFRKIRSQTSPCLLGHSQEYEAKIDRSFIRG
jgi:hypothetical protein